MLCHPNPKSIPRISLQAKQVQNQNEQGGNGHKWEMRVLWVFHFSFLMEYLGINKDEGKEERHENLL